MSCFEHINNVSIIKISIVNFIKIIASIIL